MYQLFCRPDGIKMTSEMTADAVSEAKKSEILAEKSREISCIILSSRAFVNFQRITINNP